MVRVTRELQPLGGDLPEYVHSDPCWARAPGRSRDSRVTRAIMVLQVWSQDQLGEALLKAQDL